MFENHLKQKNWRKEIRRKKGKGKEEKKKKRKTFGFGWHEV